jgi:hypothetical protein
MGPEEQFAKLMKCAASLVQEARGAGHAGELVAIVTTDIGTARAHVVASQVHGAAYAFVVPRHAADVVLASMGEEPLEELAPEQTHLLAIGGGNVARAAFELSEAR